MPLPQVRINVAGSKGLVNPDLINSVHQIATGLNAPIPQWNIHVLTEPQWEKWQSSVAATKNTGSTFSLLGTGLTYVRQKALIGKRSDQIQDMLAHEMGHLVSNSADEDVANQTRSKYYKTKMWSTN
jgi:hypothetical protein